MVCFVTTNRAGLTVSPAKLTASIGALMGSTSAAGIGRAFEVAALVGGITAAIHCDHSIDGERGDSPVKYRRSARTTDDGPYHIGVVP